MVECAIRVLQAATLLEGDPDTRGSGGASNRARRSSKREGNSEEGGRRGARDYDEDEEPMASLKTKTRSGHDPT